jgi:hypothetical protein
LVAVAGGRSGGERRSGLHDAVDASIDVIVTTFWHTRPGMWRRLQSNRFLLWTLVLAVLVVRASDAHLHLCFDGLEPPTSVHVADASLHHDDHHEEDGHADKDVDPLVGALVKSVDSDVHFPALMSASILIPLNASAGSRAVVRRQATPAASPFELRPPLRGPPA